MKVWNVKSHHVRRAGLIAVCTAVAIVFFALGALLRLLLGPISLGPFSGQLASSLTDALPGLSVHYDDAALQWSRDEGRINLVILGARVFDRDQRIIAQAPKAEIDLAAGPFLSGKIVVNRIALVGVQLTLVHTLDGTLRLGVERDHGQSDVLKELREALSSRSNNSALKSFAVREARLAFYDERTGLFVVAPEASLQIATDKNTTRSGIVAATVKAQIEISGHRASLTAKLRLPRDGNTVAGDIGMTGLAINALGENAKALAFLKPYVLKTDISGSFTLDRGSTHVRDADFGLGATGTVQGFGRPVRVKLLRLVGRYDGGTGRLLIEDGTLAGNEARAHLRGSGDLAFNDAGGLVKSTVDLTMDRIAVNMPGVMQQATTLARIALRASYTPDDNKIAILNFLVIGGPLSASLNGDITLVPGRTPAIAVTGRIAALSVKNLLQYWPLQLGEGARAWIAANVSAGDVGPVVLKADIQQGALDLPKLPEDAVNLSFPIGNATVTYLKGLTPMTDVAGTGVLTGNSFTATVDSAVIGSLKVSAGKVSIPDLSASDAPGTVAAHVDGELGDVLRLVDMKPLQYPTRFKIGTEKAKGQSAIDLSFHMPMVRNLSIDDVGISVTAQITGLALGIDGHEISNGTANIAIDNKSLHTNGKVNLAGADLTVDWNEDFITKNPITTRITASGVLDDAARENLKFHSAEYLKGPVNVLATLEGHRGSISRARLTMELTPATVMLDLINYRKPPGTPANVQITARFKNGSISGEDVALSGTGLQAQGTADFTADGTLQRLEIPSVHAGPANDFALHLSDTPSAGMKVTISGRSADGAGLGRTNPSGNGNKPAKPPGTEPFLLDAHLERLVMRKGVTMAPFDFSAAGTGDRPQSMTLSGALSKTAKLTGNLALDNGERKILLATDNAGLLMKGLFGFQSMHGGKFNLIAALSPAPNKAEAAAKRPPDYRGSVTISDFTIVNQPFLTRLFSAGSLGGLLDLLRGGGIVISKMEVPFAMHGGVLDIDGARASGPSIGITADGYLDRRNDKIALEGAMAPMYGLNSALGVIPLLGDVFVSKKGEGIFGMSYSVSGNAEEPKVGVNPLSVLAPGIFRRIFEGTPKAPPSPEANTGNKPAQPKNLDGPKAPPKQP